MKGLIFFCYFSFTKKDFVDNFKNVARGADVYRPVRDQFTYSSRLTQPL